MLVWIISHRWSQASDWKSNIIFQSKLDICESNEGLRSVLGCPEGHNPAFPWISPWLLLSPFAVHLDCLSRPVKILRFFCAIESETRRSTKFEIQFTHSNNSNFVPANCRVAVFELSNLDLRCVVVHRGVLSHFIFYALVLALNFYCLTDSDERADFLLNSLIELGCDRGQELKQNFKISNFKIL